MIAIDILIFKNQRQDNVCYKCTLKSFNFLGTKVAVGTPRIEDHCGSLRRLNKLQRRKFKWWNNFIVIITIVSQF